jgi:hypothetical protein
LDDYWLRFERRNHNNELVRDGVLFEELIKYLLEAEYNYEWTQTGMSHDDNRDFYLYSEEGHIWAECKNYKKSIAMTIVAPTLVMAQIYEVDKILFFSSSPFNKSAREKLYLYAEKTKKHLSLYDGDILIQLIRKNNKKLPAKFQLPEDIPDVRCELSCEFLFIQKPIIGVSLEDKLIRQLDSAKKIFFSLRRLKSLYFYKTPIFPRRLGQRLRFFSRKMAKRSI